MTTLKNSSIGVLMLFAILAVGCGSKPEADAEGGHDHSGHSHGEAAGEEAAAGDESAMATDGSSLEGALVEAGCGSCSYDMEGVRGCETAVKIGDASYLVTGIDFDAHAAGFCDSTKQAKVSGKIEDGKFVATAMEVVE